LYIFLIDQCKNCEAQSGASLSEHSTALIDATKCHVVSIYLLGCTEQNADNSIIYSACFGVQSQLLV
jgi:hypothetical protein